MNYVNMFLVLVLVVCFATTTLAAAPVVPTAPIPPAPVLPSPGYSGAQIDAVEAGLITKAEIRDLRTTMSQSEIDDYVEGLTSPVSSEEPTQTEPVEPIETNESEQTEEPTVPELNENLMMYIFGGLAIFAGALLIWFKYIKKPEETEGE